MPDYSQSKIYEIVCNITGERYIGSTTTALNRRYANHKCEAPLENKYCVSSQIILRGNHCIRLIEEYPCNNKEELAWKEREWIETLDCINKQKPIVNHDEELERARKHSDNFRKNNPEKIKEFNKKYSELPPIQCECGGTYTYKHKARHLETEEHRLGVDEEYRKQKEEEDRVKKEAQRERKKEYKAQWYQKRKLLHPH